MLGKGKVEGHGDGGRVEMGREGLQRVEGEVRKGAGGHGRRTRLIFECIPPSPRAWEAQSSHSCIRGLNMCEVQSHHAETAHPETATTGTCETNTSNKRNKSRGEWPQHAEQMVYKRC